MRNRTLILGLTAILSLVGSSLQAQKPADLIGTWSGQATLEGLEAPNELTLVLELKEGKLAGTMTDQYGTINQFPISDVVLDKGTLSFSSPVVGPGGAQMSIKFKMTLSEDAMKGEIEVPEMGMKGAWEAAKVK
ncbi:MAG TPA: hypothetical protein VLJ16_11590 [Acidobacteriota bacterium]|nr:hypothetical protein [Acidobacteriota bacterium]